MKCNYKRNATELRYQKGLLLSIHKSMSYQKLIDNTSALSNSLLPPMPEITSKLLIRTQINQIPVGMFIDVSSINSISNGQTAIVALTEDLLELYGVSPEQFVEDFKKEILVAQVIEQD